MTTRKPILTNAWNEVSKIRRRLTGGWRTLAEKPVPAEEVDPCPWTPSTTSRRPRDISQKIHPSNLADLLRMAAPPSWWPRETGGGSG